MSDPLGPASPEPRRPVGAADARLRSEALCGWHDWDAEAIERACAQSSTPAGGAMPAVAYWRGVVAFMRGGDDALAWLEEAYVAFCEADHRDAAAEAAHAALVICLLDSGAMDRVSDWHARVDASVAVKATDSLQALWLRMGTIARVALGCPDTPAAAIAMMWLQKELMSLQGTLSPDERLLVALVLIEYHFAAQRFEQFDFLANLVEHPALFDAASPMLRARWVHMHGYAHYQAGHHERAEKSWQRALTMAQEFGVENLRLQTTLALARLLLDRGRIDEAEAIVESLTPNWGVGRTAQLIQLQQIRGRVQLLRAQPARALATFEEALRLGDAVAMSASERASCLTDLAQAYVALERADDALELLLRLAAEHSGRDAQVYGCLHDLLRAWLARYSDPTGSRRDLERGLAQAQRARYTMFFRLLPALAASVCALALRCRTASQFVNEVIRTRNLLAPPDADAQWPWPLWLDMLDGTDLYRAGNLYATVGKTQHKPLELLRLLACERTLAINAQVAMQALWPDADDMAARKSLEMAVLRLRRLLEDATLVWVGDGRVGLDASRVSSDVQQRRLLIERIEALAMHPVDADAESVAPGECLALVERVIAFTRGELLPGVPVATWLQAERQRCAQDTVRAALAAAVVLARSPVGHAEQELLEAALRIEPLAESLVRRLMQAHQRAGQRGDALRVFENYRRQMMGRGATPGALVEAQWRELLAPGPAAFRVTPVTVPGTARCISPPHW